MTTIDIAVKILHDAVIEGTPSARIAERLDAAGLLAKEPPAPLDAEEADQTGAHTATRWKAYTTDGRGEYEETVYVDAYENEIWLVNSHDDLLDPESARALAYALLAAANHTKKE